MLSIMKRNDGDGTAPATTFSGLVDEFFQNNLNRFFDDNFWGAGRMNGQQVPVNIRETDKAYELHMPAPGLKKEDFKIDVSGDLLTVSFEHKEENKEENRAEGWLRQEYKMRSFKRSFNLGDTIDANQISARYNDGILDITLPKKEGAQTISRTVQIS